MAPKLTSDSRRRLAVSRDEVAAAALELADREGLDALTMRRLAAELGIGTMTLYGYFRSKDHLLEAVAQRASSAALIEVEGRDWRAVLRSLMVQVRDNLARHPSLAQLRLERPLLNPEAMRVTELALSALRDAGFGRAEAARAYRALFVYTFGYDAFNSPADPEGARAAARTQLAALPPREYPAVAASIEEAAETFAGDDQFEYGLDLLLAGLEARRRAATV